MADICENCGAELKEGAQFCQECGDKIENIEEVEKEVEFKYCPNCGNKLQKEAVFCEECGVNLENPEMKPANEESLIQKYKIPIIIIAIVAIIGISGAIISSMSEPEPIELPAQEVTVGSEFFRIPGGFSAVPGSFDIKTENYVFSNSQSWSDGYDTINIAVLSNGIDVDLESVAGSEGGVHKTLMGYEGYYDEIDVNDYVFTFVMDDKICVIETTSPHLFDEITVL